MSIYRCIKNQRRFSMYVDIPTCTFQHHFYYLSFFPRNNIPSINARERAYLKAAILSLLLLRAIILSLLDCLLAVWAQTPTTNSSIWHSLLPRRIRNNPDSPHLLPQEFRQSCESKRYSSVIFTSVCKPTVQRFCCCDIFLTFSF